MISGFQGLLTPIGQGLHELNGWILNHVSKVG